jgi:hypothetical protein
VAVNPTPAELNWFRRLQETAPFPITWRGKTWLESKIAEHECVARYFVEGRADEVLRMVHDLGLGGAMVRTMTEGAELVVAVARQLEEIQPYYVVDITSRGPQVTITLRPAYRAAEIDRPIVARIETAFPDTDLGRVRQSQFAVAMDFGDSVSLEPEFVRQLEVDAPPGLGGRFTNVAVNISGREDLSLNTQFECADTDGRMRASLPFHIDKRSRGARGVAMYGSDASGVVSTSIRVDPQSLTGTISFAYHPPANTLRGALSAPTRFIASMTAPGVLRIRFEGGLSPLELPLPKGSDVWCLPSIAISLKPYARSSS